jgi:deoxyribonuclease IV
MGRVTAAGYREETGSDPLYSPDYDAAMHFGGHLSTAGGLDKAVGRAQDIHSTALQIFTQSPRMWKHPDPDPEMAERFRARRASSRVASVTCHATYLINLGATDRAIRRKSINALSATLTTAHMIGAEGVVFHLGSHLGKGFGRALPRTAKAIETVLADAPEGCETALLIENSAGAGGTMGVTLDEIQQVIDALGRHRNVGVCLDSCHLYATGIDITDPAQVDDLWDEADERFGLERVQSLHINDSAMPLGSNRDRHANVGAGLIGEGLATFLGHPRIQHLPAVMETAGAGDGPDAEQMAQIRRLHRNGVRRWARRA